MTRPLPLLPLLLLLATVTASAQTPDTIRVCTWNVLNYGATVDSTRAAAIQSVIRAIRPHILVAQELNGDAGILAFFNQVRAAVAPSEFGGTGNDGPDTDNAIYYDTSKFLYPPRSFPIQTSLRDIGHWVLVFRANPEDTLHVFSCHLKAGDTDADSMQRAEEAALIRQATDGIPREHRFILAGDLNTYTSTEGAYRELTYLSRTLPGHFADPIDSPGDWHADTVFAHIHTQSPRVRQFGGGIGGGLDDRFDFVLLSQRLMNENYLPGSYTAFGNDGRHFNDSINAMPNTAVPDSIAEALHVASDHLPVYLDLVFPGRVSGVREEKVRVGPMDLTEERGR